MAYTTPPLKTVGDTLTAAEWNAAVRDNMAAGVPGAFTTKGQIPVASGSMAGGLLSVGSDYSILQSRAGATLGTEWATGAPGFIVRHGNPSIPTNTLTAVPFNLVEKAWPGFTLGTYISIPAGMGGYWGLTVSGNWDPVADTTLRSIYIVWGGGGIYWTGSISNNISGEDIHQCAHYEIDLAAGENVSMYVKHKYAGGNLVLLNARLALTKLR
jgi:hypothetical protein